MSSFVVINCDGPCDEGVTFVTRNLDVEAAEIKLSEERGWKIDIVTGELLCEKCAKFSEVNK